MLSTYKGLAPALDVVPQAKTASYTVKPGDDGAFFTNRGAGGAIVFTLPAVATIPAGWSATFYVIADQSLTVTAPAGTMVAFNNAACASVAFSTTSEKIGGAIRVRFDGTSYLAQVMIGLETQTPVVS